MGEEELINSLYLEYGKDKKNLECTKAILDVWKQVLGMEGIKDKADQLELGALNQAKYEWGKETRITFDREKRTAEIVNVGLQRRCTY